MRPLSLLLLLAACTGKGPSGDTDPDCDLLSWYPDVDDDGYGEPGDPLQACIAPGGYVDNDLDCDDTSATVNPEASERCDGVDNDCDGLVDAEDDPVNGLATYFRDADSDGYGDPQAPTSACDAPEGYVSNDDDCDDGEAAAYPGGREVCDELDNDCDQLIDDGDPVVYDAPRWYPDADEDAWGATYGALAQCEGPEGYVTLTGDCEDRDPAIHPAAQEVCDLIDNDCDDLVDEEDDTLDPATESTWYPDADDDGWGDDGGAVLACFEPDDHTTTPGDCDDSLDDVYPGAVEYCNSTIDEDCDGADASCEELTSAGEWTGVSVGDAAGSALVGVGDVTGDGLPDWAAGAHLGYDGSLQTGVAYVVSADATPGSFADSWLTLVGEYVGDRFGGALAGGVDVDGDGGLDLLVGASRHDRGSPDAGVVYAVSLASGGTVYPDPTTALLGLIGENASDYFGSSVAFAGDQDGDGDDDLLVGATGHDGGGNNAGAAYLITEHTGFGDLNGTWYTWTGEGIGDQAGATVQNLGDVNGDGTDDLAVAAPDADSGAAYAGAVYVLLGPVSSDGDLASADARWYGSGVTERCGTALGSADLDGDGSPDLIVGCPQADGDWLDTGAVSVVYTPGVTGGDLVYADVRITGESPEILLGDAVAGVPDLDGDGLDELVATAPAEDSGGTDAGAVYLFYGGVSGAVDAADYDLKWIGEAANDRTADPVLPVDDLTGDGVPDFLFGSPDTSATREGKVYLVDGS